MASLEAGLGDDLSDSESQPTYNSGAPSYSESLRSLSPTARTAGEIETTDDFNGEPPPGYVAVMVWGEDLDGFAMKTILIPREQED